MKKICLLSFMLIALTSCSDDREFCNKLGKKSDATPDELSTYSKKCLNSDASKKYP